MGKLSKGFMTREYKFTDTDNVEQTIILKPLKGDHLHLIFRLAGKFKDTSEESLQVVLSEAETLKDVTTLCTETLKRSIGDDEDIDAFVSQHMFSLFPIIIELNVPKTK